MDDSTLFLELLLLASALLVGFYIATGRHEATRRVPPQSKLTQQSKLMLDAVAKNPKVKKKGLKNGAVVM